MTFKSNLGRNKSKGYTTNVITEKALNWIKNKRDKDKPFVAWISHTAAHRSWLPPTRYLTKYDDRVVAEPETLFTTHQGKSIAARLTQMRIAKDLFPAYDLKLPPTGKGILDRGAKGKLRTMNSSERAAWDAAYGPKNTAFSKAHLTGKALVRWKYQRYIKDYLRCVSAVDDSVGRVMQFLKDNDLEDNTIVIYSADQGFFLGDHGWYDKRWMYEPAFKTPLIIKWPGVVKPNTVNNDLVRNIDMAPTILAMTARVTDATMHGKSLVPLLKGHTPADWRDAVYYHYQESGRARTQHNVAKHYGIRTQRYKLIYIYEYDQWEMYDLKSDPQEVRNLYADASYAKIVARLKVELKALRQKFADQTGKDMP